MFAYDFQTNRIPGDPPDQPAYWRDVGTIDAYYEASMDLRSVKPELNLYNRQWPLRTAGYQDPPVHSRWRHGEELNYRPRREGAHRGSCRGFGVVR
jgi:ADP-glucose pyrophosphorylase